jgi:hypothetical protein
MIAFRCSLPLWLKCQDTLASTKAFDFPRFMTPIEYPGYQFMFYQRIHSYSSLLESTAQ